MSESRLALLGSGYHLCHFAEMIVDQGFPKPVIVTHPKSEHERDRLLYGKSKAFQYLFDLADRLGLEVIETKKINESKLINHLVKELNCNTAFSLSCRSIIRSDFIQAFDGNIFNIHPSILPKEKGGGTFSWRILNNNKEISATLHLLDTGIDTGGIIFQKKDLLTKDRPTPEDYIIGTNEIYVELLEKFLNLLTQGQSPKDESQELPPKTEVTLKCELSEAEQELYQTLLASAQKEVVEKLNKGKSVFAALELLLRLRQVCCDPRLVPGTHEKFTHESSKIKLLMETLTGSIELGHRSLVFSQWTSFLDLIEIELDKKKIQYLRLDGSTRNRSALIEKFQSPDGPSTFLISLKAGGTGLNLTRADHVFITDPWWNPAVEDQAADRAHRIGQTQPVLIHRLVAKNTIEERVLELQESKRLLAKEVLTGSLRKGSFSREDLLEVLKP